MEYKIWYKYMKIALLPEGRPLTSCVSSRLRETGRYLCIFAHGLRAIFFLSISFKKIALISSVPLDLTVPFFEPWWSASFTFLFGDRDITHWIEFIFCDHLFQWLMQLYISIYTVLSSLILPRTIYYSCTRFLRFQIKFLKLLFSSLWCLLSETSVGTFEVW